MEPIYPMEPVMSGQVPSGEAWTHQIKWDGVRCLTYFDGERVRLFNRRLRERTLHYPELVDVASYCTARSVILDGEVIAFGPDGKPSFHEVMRRDGIRRMERVAMVRKSVPVVYMIFDVLFVNGEWINRRPLTERLDILAGVIKPSGGVQVVPTNDDGEALYRVIEEHGMEGIVSKKKNSPYLIGEKKDHWLKVKNYRDMIAVVGGFTLNGGIVNAILLGLYDETGKLWYIGHSGSGKLTSQDWVELTKTLQSQVVKDRPFTNKPERERDAFWVQPTLTVKIQYVEWTEGRSLRQPVIQAFVDVPPERCVLEDELIR
ncbi:MAG: ATP-dependent DNA ligase [Tumebacillaceae bacterium]